MIGAVLFYSLGPVAFIVGGGTEAPFFFNAGWRFGSASGSLLILGIFFWHILIKPRVIGLSLRSVASWMMLGALPVNFDYAFFSSSSRFIDPSIAAVLLEMGPILIILLTGLLLREGGGYRTKVSSMIPFLVIAFVGLLFLITAENGGFSLDDTHLSELAIGLGLGLLSAVSVATVAFQFRWGRDLGIKLTSLVPEVRSRASLIIFGAIVAQVIGSFVGAMLSAGIGFTVGETMGTEVLEYVGYGFVGGILIHAPGAVLFRTANLLTNNLGINALAYITPVFSLCWLALVSEIGVARPDFLIIGAAAIVAVNLLLNFEVERLLGFKALVISLWLCGTVVYLRNPAGWGWIAKSDSYFDVLFLSATVFALILSFRAVRLASRTQEEDNLALKLFRVLEELAERGAVQPEVSRFVAVMDEKEGRELEAAYIAARQAVNQALLKAAGQDREKLREVEVDLDILAHSRQQGINFGEICALFIFAGLVVGTALLTRPADVQGLTGFLVEMFAMLFPAVIIFLTFNVLDLQRGRVARILISAPQYQGYGVAFQDTVSVGETVAHSGRRTAEQWISVGVGLALIVAYAGLFLHKWGLLPQVLDAVLNPLS